jgi:hypothetical protein
VIISLGAIESDFNETRKVLLAAVDKLSDIAEELYSDGFENFTVAGLHNRLEKIINTFDDCL